MLKSIKISNFRSLKDFQMEFNEGLNVIIGENDAGKTSLIDSLKILFGVNVLDINDFNDINKKVIFELESNDEVFYSEFSFQDDKINTIFKFRLSVDKCDDILLKLSSESFINKSDEDQLLILKEYCDFLDISYRSNSKKETIESNLINRLNEFKDNKLIDTKSLKYPISFLGSREFEDINSFFENTFFKEVKENIWDFEIDNKSLKTHISDYILDYKNSQLTNENAYNLNNTLKEFLPNFKEIDIEVKPIDPKIKLDVNVKLLNSQNQPILIEKMGDGTNRRTTMAIFEHKQDKNDLCYVFDEPDTHLHINAQLDILKLFKELTNEGKQVIITTHSPFLINGVDVNNIKLMSLNLNNSSEIKSLSTDEEIKSLLNNLGISNIDLFFTKKLLIVEGDSEKLFLPAMYEKIYGFPISHNFIKIVKAEGINHIPNFVKIIKQSFDNINLFLFMDNDAPHKTISKLKEYMGKNMILEDNIFIIGDVEFEDSFSNDIILKALNKYITNEGFNFENRVTVEDIEEIRESNKFSKGLNDIIYKICGGKLNKPHFAQILVSCCEKEDLDNSILELFELISRE